MLVEQGGDQVHDQPDATVQLTPDLRMVVRWAFGEVQVKLDAVAAQMFAGALQRYSGQKATGVGALGDFHTVLGERVQPAKRPREVVRIGGRK
jgi:hypothetical protein